MSNKPDCKSCGTSVKPISPAPQKQAERSHQQHHNHSHTSQAPIQPSKPVKPTHTHSHNHERFEHTNSSNCDRCHNHTCTCNTHFHAEDHCDYVNTIEYKSKFYVESNSTFNMPACGDTAIILVDDADGLFAGMSLYSLETGHIDINRVIDSRTIEIKNPCSDDTIAAPGKPILKGTKFIPTAPGAYGLSTGNTCADQNTRPYLATPGLIIPDINATADAKVTTVAGLSNNDTVSINGYQYKIVSILNAYTIRILNDGDGDVPGTALDADSDCDGCMTYPIIKIEGENICSKTTVQQGLPVVCVNGEQYPLKGTKSNQILMYNEAAGVFQLKIIPELRACAVLASCLQLDPLNTTGYIVSITGDDLSFVSSTAPDNIISVDGRDFIVDEIIDSNASVGSTITSMVLRIKLITPVTATINISTGSSVCEAECCTKLQEQIKCAVAVIAPPCPLVQQQVIPVNVDLSLTDNTFYEHPTPVSTCSYTNNTTCPQLVVFDANILDRINYNGVDKIAIMHDFLLAIDGDQNPLGPRFTFSQLGRLAEGVFLSDKGPLRGTALPFPTTWGFAAGTVIAQKKVAPGATVTFSVHARAFYNKAEGNNSTYSDGFVTTVTANMRVFNTD